MEEFDELDVIRASELQENENQARRRMLSGGYTRFAQTTTDPSVTVESLESKLDAMQRTLLHIGNQLGIRLIEAETSRQTHSVTHSTAMENFIEFPVFDGASGDLKQWILWLEEFFVQERFTALEKMNLAHSLLEGKAEVWFYRNQQLLPFQSWEDLKFNLWLMFGDFDDYDRLFQEQRVEKRRKRLKTTSIPEKDSLWETEKEALVPADTIPITNLTESRETTDSTLATKSIQEAISESVMDGGVSVSFETETSCQAIEYIHAIESFSAKESIEKDEPHETRLVKVEGDTTMFLILDSLEDELITQNQVHVSKLEHSLQVQNESPNVCENYQDVVAWDELSKEENLLSGLSQISQVWEPGGVFKLKEHVGLVNQKQSRGLKASMFNFKRKKKRIKRWFNTLSCRESWRKPKHERLLCNLCNLRAPRGLGQLILDDLKSHMRHKWKSNHLRAVYLQTNPSYALDVVTQPVTACNTTAAIFQLVLERSVSHDCFLGSLWEKKNGSWLGVVCVLAACMMHNVTAMLTVLQGALHGRELDVGPRIKTVLEQLLQEHNVWVTKTNDKLQLQLTQGMDLQEYADGLPKNFELEAALTEMVADSVTQAILNLVTNAARFGFATVLTVLRVLCLLGILFWSTSFKKQKFGKNWWYKFKHRLWQRECGRDLLEVEVLVAEAVVKVKFDDVGHRELLIDWRDHDASETSWMFFKAFVHLYLSFKLEDKLGLQGGSIVMNHQAYLRRKKEESESSNARGVSDANRGFA